MITELTMGIVSGAWGIGFYKEVAEIQKILKWAVSAFVTISGILLLGHVSHV